MQATCTTSMPMEAHSKPYITNSLLGVTLHFSTRA
jgi:hypothetical protein